MPVDCPKGARPEKCPVSSAELALCRILSRAGGNVQYEQRATGIHIKVDPDREQLSSKETDCGRITRAARPLPRKPTLAFTRIIVRKQMGSAVVPPRSQPVSQLQPYL